MGENATLKDHLYERRVFLSRLIVGGVIALLLFALLIARLVYLQVYGYEYYSGNADNNRISRQPVVPTRGLIYDRNGVLLATNQPSFTLTMVREAAANLDESLSLLEQLIELGDDEVSALRTRLSRRTVPFSAVPVRFNLSEEEMARIAVNQFRLPGFNVQAQLIRHYPHGEAMAHALGYLGTIAEEDLRIIDRENYRGTHLIGKSGVERFYEEILHGQIGYEMVEKNARGQIMKVLDRTDPVPGQDIVLHLDSQLQMAVMAAMEGHRGGIVALDVDSGGVLAMVSTPSFDPNLFIGGISQEEFRALNDPVQTPMFNRALGRYAPGSTLKPFLGLAGLDYGIRTREHTVYDPGHFTLPNSRRRYHDWTWWINRSGHGHIDMQRAIYQSCDVYFYDMSVSLGIDRMQEFMGYFGFGQNTSIDIPRANSGVLPTRDWKRETMGEAWFPGDTVNASIGQGFTETTPLQLATATLVMANRGIWRQPVMLKQFGRDGEDIVHPSSMPDIKLNNEDDWEFIISAMEDVVHKGTGGYRHTGTAYPYTAMLDPMPYRMAGKTGTAQVVGIPEGFDRNEEIPERFRDHALFIAFAPADNPKIALAVFVEHGQGGSSVAAPIAKQIIDAYLLDENGAVKPEFLPEFPDFSLTLAAGSAGDGNTQSPAESQP